MCKFKIKWEGGRVICKHVFQITLLTGSLGIPFFSAGAPLLGKYTADAHQICGKGIDVELKKNGNKLIIGLINHKTNRLDLFESSSSVSSEGQFVKFLPVRYDELSKTFILVNNKTLDIIWGSSVNDNKIVYNLTLGSHVYNCGAIQKWPNEASDALYGE